jgi:hypothetical protein
MNDLSDLYQTDYHAWVLKTAELLRQGQFEQLNIEALAEELESLGKKECKEIANCFVILLAHLLKWQFQPMHRSNSWRGSIIEQRKQILRQLKFSPSVKPHIPEAILDAYPDAVEIAIDETGLPETVFPVICPYTEEQMLDKTFYPVSVDA